MLEDYHLLKPVYFSACVCLGCGGRAAEIVYCLDASGSIWGPDFQRQLTFVNDVNSVFQVSADRTRVGVLTFGDQPQDWFHLGDHHSEDQVAAAVSQITQSRGGTNTASALARMREEFFHVSRVRDGVIKMAIVVTDGKSEDRDATAEEAARLKAAGVHVFAVGVGRSVDRDELSAIGSQPSSEYVFAVENYDALATIKKLLAIQTCKGRSSFIFKNNIINYDNAWYLALGVLYTYVDFEKPLKSNDAHFALTISPASDRVPGAFFGIFLSLNTGL